MVFPHFAAGRHGHTKAFQKILGGALAVLQDRRLLLGPQDPLSLFLEDIDYAIREIALRPNEGQVDLICFGECQQLGNAFRWPALHLGQAAFVHHLASRIAGRDEHLLHSAASGEGMGYGVSPAPRIHHKDSLAGQSNPYPNPYQQPNPK